MNKKIAAVIHGVVIILELIALAYVMHTFGFGLVKYYTILSNVLQLILSIWSFSLLRKEQELPEALCIGQLVAAVCLTVTFLIAALVLAPQEGFDYYFLSDVAPINHFLGPLFSIILFLFFTGDKPLKKISIAAPLAVSLAYGVVMLLMNALRVADGPYFFLRVYDEKAGTIVMWFCVIALLCLLLAGLYLFLRHLVLKRRSA